MAKINTYRLKDGITAEDLDKLGFKEGSWLNKYKGIECMSKSMMIYDSIRLYIIIKINPVEFDDFEDTLVLDDDFGQPYTPFYGDNYKREIDSSSYLGIIADRYNQAMDFQGIFDIVNEQN